MAERSIAAVLKTVDPKGSGGSNPSLSANVRFMKEKLTYAMIGGAEGSFIGSGGSNPSLSATATPPRSASGLFPGIIVV